MLTPIPPKQLETFLLDKYVFQDKIYRVYVVKMIQKHFVNCYCDIDTVWDNEWGGSNGVLSSDLAPDIIIMDDNITIIWTE